MPIEILLEKKKLLLTSNIFFPSVFKRLKLQTHKTRGLFGNGLTVLLKLVIQIYFTLSLFSPMKRVHLTVPVKLQNVKLLLKYEKGRQENENIQFFLSTFKVPGCCLTLLPHNPDF